MSPENILAIDNGTQSVRALLFDPRGNLLAKEQTFFEPYIPGAPGICEQDPSIFWNAVCSACQGLFRQSGVDKSSIAAVSLTTQRSTVINVDEKGNPLRPAIVWLDQRRTEGIPPVGGFWGLTFKAIGITDTVSYFQAEAEANWIRINQPDIWEKTHKYLFLSGYLTHKLVGRFVDSVGAQVGYLPFDYKAQAWAKKSDWKWQAVPIPEEYLPDLIQPGSSLGSITREAAALTGIPEGLPLIAAAADKACEVIGAGCLSSNLGSISFGTTATINTTHERYIEVIPLVPPYPAAVPGHYNLEVQIYRGYWMVNWFKNEFGKEECRQAEQIGVQAEELLETLISKVPAGSDGLILQPYWSPGLKLPGPEAKGAIIGFKDIHTRAHVYRAIIEGISYALREGADRSVQRSNKPMTEIRISGGGSQSNQAVQLTADIFNLPTARPHVYEASGLGAAIDAAVGVGIHSDFTTAVSEMTRVSDYFEPNPQSHEIYEELYQNVYRKMYNRLLPLYQSLYHDKH